MNAAPLPVLAAVALPAAVAPTAPASSATAAAPGAFAQQLSQAQASAPAEDAAAEASADAQAPTPPPADEAAPQRPASTSEEAPVTRSLKQWLQQSAAARRAAQKAVHDAARLSPQAAAEGERTESLSPGMRARRGAHDADIDTAATPGTPSAGAPLDPATVDKAPRTDDPARSGASDSSQTSDKPLSAAPDTASPAAATVPALPAPPPAPGTPSPVSDATTPQPAAVALTTAPGRTEAASDEAERTEPQAAADDRSGASRPAVPERAAAPAKGDGALETDRQRATTAPPPLAGKGAREAAVDSATPSEERESFAAALARQQDGVALPMPTAPPVNAPAARTETMPATPRPPVDVPVPADFNGPQWAQSVGNQLSMLATDGVQNARLHLHPAEMGPISVQIVVDGQTAQVHLAVDNAETRQALEQAMPNLAASLRESGLTLTGGGVFEQPRQRADNPPDQTRPGAGRGNERGAGNERTEALAGNTPPARSLRRQGVVDLYA